SSGSRLSKQRPRFKRRTWGTQHFDSNLALENYWYLSATSGSTREARRAGIQQATTPVANSRATAAASVTGSLAETPHSWAAINLLNARLAVRPITTPTT